MRQYLLILAFLGACGGGSGDEGDGGSGNDLSGVVTDGAVDLRMNMSPLDGPQPDLTHVNQGSDAGPCAGLNADCTSENCCGNNVCDPTAHTCMTPPCAKSGEDCTILDCCSGLSCSAVSYRCN
jgi:hypothetical protein